MESGPTAFFPLAPKRTAETRKWGLRHFRGPLGNGEKENHHCPSAIDSVKFFAAGTREASRRTDEKSYVKIACRFFLADAIRA